MKIKKKKTTGECRSCIGQKKRKDFSSITIAGNKVLKCKRCDYFNSPEIFNEWVDIETPALIFGQPL